MNFELYQLIALASGSNAVLTRRIALESIYPSHTAFQGCRKITFENPAAGNLLDGPAVWLEYLSKSGLLRVGLRTTGNNRPGFESLFLTAEGGNAAVAWSPALSELLAGRHRDAHYRLLPASSITAADADLVAASQSLRDALSEIQTFARRHRLGFEDCFAKGLKLLDSSSPLKNCRHHPLIAARLYPLEARQLMAACWRSWVFGGMGSWNDQGFSDPQKMRRFEQVSNGLYSALISGFQATVNSFPH